MEIEDACALFPFSFNKRPHVKYYRIFSIKRRGRLFKTRPCIPGVYSNPRLFVDQRLFIKCIFQPPFFNISVGGLLNQKPNFNKNVNNEINFVSSK